MVFKVGDRVRYDYPSQNGTVTYADEHIFEVTPDSGKGGIRRFSQNTSGLYYKRNRRFEYPTKIL